MKVMEIIAKLDRSDEEAANLCSKLGLEIGVGKHFIIHLKMIDGSKPSNKPLEFDEKPQILSFQIPEILMGKQLFVNFIETGSVSLGCSAVICGTGGQKLSPYMIQKSFAFFSTKYPFVVVNGYYLSNAVKIYKYSIVVKNNIATIEPEFITFSHCLTFAWKCLECGTLLNDRVTHADSNDQFCLGNYDLQQNVRRKNLFLNGGKDSPFVSASIAAMERAETVLLNRPFYYL